MDRAHNFSFQGMGSPLRGYYGHSPYGHGPSYMPSYGMGVSNYTNHLLHTSPLYPHSTTRPMSAPHARLNYTDGLPLSNQSAPLSNNNINPATSEQSSSSPQEASSLSSSSAPSSITETPLSKTTTATLTGAYRGQRLLHGSPDSGFGASSMYLGSSGFPSPPRTGGQQGTSLLPDPFMPSPRLPLGYDQNKHIGSLLAEIDNQRTEIRKVEFTCTIFF